MFSAAGITVTGQGSLGLNDGYGMVTHRQIAELTGNVDGAAIGEADAIVLSCTGWRTLDLIPELQQSLGKPVISSNLAIGLHARRMETDAV